MKNKIFVWLKRVYNSLPINYKLKNKLKSIFYRCFGRAFKNTASYRVWNAMNMESVKQAESLEITQTAYKDYSCNKKIAVQVHLFYVDLIKEFFGYLSNIPFKFDLLISITDKSDKEMVYEEFSGLDNVQNIIINIVPNQGRDVAPLISVFAEKVLEYDYICHIHSKKSLYSGSEQEQWRRYLLEGLLGNADIVRSHLFQLDKGDNIGLIYPETFEYLPYYGHSWMKNKFARNELLDRIGVNISTLPEYIDYPMGTMFWAKVSAIRQFFEAKIAMNEFDREMGQKDGTLAHGFERCVGVVCNYNGSNVLILDKEKASYAYNRGQKNMNQYWIKSYEDLKEVLKDYDIVSFDIFDTLLSRKLSNSQTIYKMIEECVDKEFGIASDFNNIRINAERDFRNTHAEKDCDLDDIYNVISKMSKLDNSIINYAKEKELEIEYRTLVPKQMMIDVLKYVKKSLGKQVYIISDMHLRKDDIEKILFENGITEYDALLLSSDMNKRKDDGTMWEYFSLEHKNKKCIHIGDNEVADVQEPEYAGINNYHVLSNKALLQLSNMGQALYGVDENNIVSSIELGLIMNELCREPFKYNKDKFNIKLDSAKQFGYAFFGPVILNYILWLIGEAKEHGCSKILFLAREGYLLKQVYDELLEGINEEYPKSEYTLVSRRALSFASLCEDDIYKPLDIFFEGKLSDLLNERYGIEEIQRDEDIKLPDDAGKVKKVLEKYKASILQRAKEERQRYIEYISNVLGNDENIIVSDIGYSGTIQYYLSGLTGKTFFGRYFATDNLKKPLQISGNSILGFYIDGDEEQEISKSNIHRYHLLLEAILIAPYGQFLRIDKENNPVYQEENELYNDTIRDIQDGIVRYAKEYAKISDGIIISKNIDSDLPEKLMKLIISGDIVADEIINNIKIEDKYCGGGYREPITYYRNRNL